MKTKFICMLLVFMLSISITGCSGSSVSSTSGASSTSGSGSGNSSISTNNKSSGSNASNTISASTTNGNNITGSSVPTSPSSTSSGSTSENMKTQILSNSSVLEAYKSVLQNKAEFFSTDNKKNLYLNDFLTNKEIYGTIFKVTHFTVLDMDGDKTPEVVLELSVGDEPEFYEVLHYTNGVVYGYLIVYRGLEELKADGTFLFSSGAADNGWGKLSFQTNALKTDILGYSKSSQGDANLTISYFINNKPVSKESFDSFMHEQAAKIGAAWYEFSQRNIDAELSANP